MPPPRLVYRYQPAGLDAWERRPNAPVPGALVVKCRPPGCPPNGTLGHCFVADAHSGRFHGRVLETSPVPLDMTIVR